MREPLRSLRYTFFVVLLVISVLSSYSQPAVDGSRLIYARIDSVSAYDNNNVDTVYVNNTSGLVLDDTILIIQTIGATPIAPGNPGEGDAQSLWNTGRYSIVKVKEVVPAQNMVVLNTRLVNFNAYYHEGEFGQLIKIPSYKTARITSSLSVPSWDPAVKTGGVFPVIVSQKLVLETDLRLDGKGFHGAEPSGQYNGPCLLNDPAYQEPYYGTTATDTAALKGESIVRDAYSWARGYGKIMNGGGGGNGRFSGGGGGSNMGQGGKGGDESDACSSSGIPGGEGGQSLQGFTSQNASSLYYNRVFMGGGGGSGNQDVPDLHEASKGGNGGGIIIIIADTVVANNHAISSNGESVQSVATAGAGGGGAGGTLILDVRTILGDLSVEAKGGSGGNTSAQGELAGPGGGGGGGAVWYSGNSIPTEMNVNIQAGNRGTANGFFARGSLPGSPGKILTNLQVPVNGFLLNFMPGDQTICENEVPQLIDAPLPRGGDGSYSYLWQQSSDAISWSNAAGTNNTIAYQPPALTDTTWYRRIVDDGILPPDTSFSVAINVHPSIEGNLFINEDTVCFNTAPGDLTPLNSIQGGIGTGTYFYTWQESEDNSTWNAAAGQDELPSYDPPALYDTTWYRRIVQSGACVDTGNHITIIVLDSIGNNFIITDQEVCHNQIPDPLTGSDPAGGLPGDKRYLWQVNEGTGWNNILQTRDYAPGSLSSGNYVYRRVVYSGASNECIDTSNNINIISWPDITQNNLLNGDSIICADLPSLSLSGSQPQNGSGNYTFVWQSAENAEGTWNTGETTEENTDFLPGSLSQDKWFRRLVYSGEGNVCADTSLAIKIAVLPVITNNLISNDQLVCEGITPFPLTGEEVTGGAGEGSYIYQWQVRPSGSDEFTDLMENGNMPVYDIQPRTDSALYRRLIFSGPQNTCRDTSNIVEISVLPAIDNNIISGTTEKDVCKGEDILLTAGELTGGNGHYNYSWQISNNGINWEAAPSENNSEDYTSEMVVSPHHFRRLAVSSVCSDTSGAVYVDTLSLPLLTRLTVNRDSICHLEKDFQLELQVDYGQAPFSVDFTNGIDSQSFRADDLAPSGAISVTSFPQDRYSYSYSILSISDSNGCVARENNLQNYSASLELFPDAEPVILLDDHTQVCDDILSIGADPDLANVYWWSVDNSSINISDSTALSASVTLPGGFNRQEGWLTFHAASPGCLHLKEYEPSVDSVFLSFFEQPEFFNIPAESEIIFLVDQHWIYYQASPAGDLSWEVTAGGGEINNVTRDSSLVVSIPEDTRSTYRATLSNGVCEPLTDEILIERRGVHIYEGISPANEDMINDFLVAEGLDAEDVSFEFQVFASNGLLVRTITDADIEKLGFRSGLQHHGLELWDGKAANEQSYVPPGVYYYVLQIDYKGKDYTKKGFVVVKE